MPQQWEQVKSTLGPAGLAGAGGGNAQQQQAIMDCLHEREPSEEQDAKFLNYFSQLDADGDGRISRAEFCYALRHELFFGRLIAAFSRASSLPEHLSPVPKSACEPSMFYTQD